MFDATRPNHVTAREVEADPDQALGLAGRLLNRELAALIREFAWCPACRDGRAYPVPARVARAFNITVVCAECGGTGKAYPPERGQA